MDRRGDEGSQKGGDGGVAGGAVGGEDGGVRGGPSNGTLGGAGSVAVAAPQLNVTVPFGDGMTPPTLVAGPSQPQYSRAALDARVEGKVIARCVLTPAGVLVQCRIVKSQPYLDDAVLAVLAAQRYTPVLYQGHPQQVYYTLTFRFKLP